MEMVRSRSGIPTTEDFRNSTGTPIVVESTLGRAYVLLADGSISDISKGQSTVATTPRISKSANGYMLTMSAGDVLEGAYLDGNGTTLEGGGVAISTGVGSGTNANDRRFLFNCWIQDTKGPCIDFTQAQAGYASLIFGCVLIPTNPTQAAIECNVAGETNGNRTISHCWTQSNPIADLGVSDNSVIYGCNGGAPLMEAGTLKSAIVGNRLVISNPSTFTVDGDHSAIVGNVINGDTIKFAATCIGIQFKGNAVGTEVTIIDSAPGVSAYNYIDLPYTTYTPTWAATGGSPAIGNGTLIGAYERQGAKCFVNIKLTSGSGTTWAGTAWTFSVPYTATRDQTGSAVVVDATTGKIYHGICEIAAGASVVRAVVADPVTNDYVGSAIPFAWAAAGDRLTLDIWFWIN